MKKVIKTVMLSSFAILLCGIFICQYRNFAQQSYYDRLKYMFNRERLFLWEELDDVESVEYDSSYGISFVYIQDTRIMVKTALGSQTISGLEWEPIGVLYKVNEEISVGISYEKEGEKLIIVYASPQHFYIRGTEKVKDEINLKEITGFTTEEIVKLAEEKMDGINSLLDSLFQEEKKRKLALLVMELGVIAIVSILLIIQIIRKKST